MCLQRLMQVIVPWPHGQQPATPTILSDCIFAKAMLSSILQSQNNNAITDDRSPAVLSP
jgi:hypothetical protein